MIILGISEGHEAHACILRDGVLLAAIAEQHGHEAMMIDAEADCLPMDKTIKKAMDLDPDVICVTGMSPFFHLSKTFAEGLKEAGCKIPFVIGGQHITIMEEKVFFPCFDYGFIGEVEDTFPVFLDCLISLNSGRVLFDVGRSFQAVIHSHGLIVQIANNAANAGKWQEMSP